jgi:AcrR family transcriptional regulator
MSVPSPERGAEPRGARSAAATRRKLVDAGTRLFAKSGVHGVTSAQIASEAGVATGTFYLHFKHKHQLFREIAFSALADLRARQDEAGGAHPSGSFAELRARTGELFAFAEDNRDLIRVVFGRGAELSSLGEEILDEIVPAIEKSLEARRVAREIDVHPAVAAQGIAALTVRIMAWWIDHPLAASKQEVVETVLRMHPRHPEFDPEPH